MFKYPSKKSIVEKGLPVIREHFPIDGETALIETQHRKVLVPISILFTWNIETANYQTVEVSLDLKVMVKGWSFYCGYCKETNELYFSFWAL